MIVVIYGRQNYNTAAEDMDHDLELIRQLAYDWRMSFNPDLQKQVIEIIFSRKRNTLNQIKIDRETKTCSAALKV